MYWSPQRKTHTHPRNKTSDFGLATHLLAKWLFANMHPMCLVYSAPVIMTEETLRTIEWSLLEPMTQSGCGAMFPHNDLLCWPPALCPFVSLGSWLVSYQCSRLIPYRRRLWLAITSHLTSQSHDGITFSRKINLHIVCLSKLCWERLRQCLSDYCICIWFMHVKMNYIPLQINWCLPWCGGISIFH